jgi:hypothetical protein
VRVTDPAHQSAESRARSIEHIERAMGSVEHVIDVARTMLADGLGDPERNQQRIIDGETELAAMRAEIEALRVGDVEAFRDAADTFPKP